MQLCAHGAAAHRRDYGAQPQKGAGLGLIA
jgi:hypothetical protein